MAYYLDLSLGVSDAWFDDQFAMLSVPVAWIAGTFGLAALILQRRRVP